ncbi:VOC family protein [Cellulomonas endophytica]|uniref:VOC family protein n=1 Tax=Cellulomonas endophytica TaxID=2494735 RepID=UPI0010107C56|nr:VOC family protein [Cellulomonas endophytica]
MDVRIELLTVPVTDVDRAIAFYVDRAGFVLDHDVRVDATVRFVQVTPPGSACSIMLDSFSGAMPPGTQQGIQCVVADADAARAELLGRGVDASEVDDQPWGRFTSFADPDGNTWTYQELPPRDAV